MAMTPEELIKLQQDLEEAKKQKAAREKMGDLTRGQEERGLGAPAFTGDDSPLAQGLSKLASKISDPYGVSDLESKIANEKLSSASIVPVVAEPVIDVEAQKAAIDSLPPVDTATIRPDTLAELNTGTYDIDPNSGVESRTKQMDVPQTPLVEKKKVIAPPKTQQEKNLRKVANDVVNSGQIAPEQKKDYLEMLLQEYRDSRQENKKEVERAAMYDAIINASTSFAKAAGVDKRFLPEKASDMAGTAKAEKAAQLQELMNQINVEKGLKGLKPEEITAYQQAQLEMAKQGQQLSREKFEEEKRQGKWKVAGNKVYDMSSGVPVEIGGKTALSTDPDSASSIALREKAMKLIPRNYHGEDAKAFIKSLDGLSEYELKEMNIDKYISGDSKNLMSNEDQERFEEARIIRAEKLKEKDRDRLQKVQERVAFGSRGGKLLATTITKHRTIADGLDTLAAVTEIDPVTGEKQIPTSQMGQELASIIASVLKGTGTATEGEVQGLMPKTHLADYAKIMTWVTSNPQKAMSKPMLKEFEKMLRREEQFWANKIRQQDATLYMTIKPILERKDRNGKRVNKDLMENWTDFLETKQKELDIKGSTADRLTKDDFKNKVIIRKGVNKSTGDIQLIYADGTKEIIKGKR